MEELALAAPDMAHIDALLDDPMTCCIMAIDGIEREDARRLFHEVALRLRRPLPVDMSSAEQASGIFFSKDVPKT